MSALKSLALAIEVATRARDQADQALMQARRAVQQAQGQLDQLESYAADTESRWATASAVSLSAELMQHHHHFQQRLRQAIGMQQGVMSDLQRQAEAARLRRVQEEVRLAAFQQLLKKKLASDPDFCYVGPHSGGLHGRGCFSISGPAIGCPGYPIDSVSHFQALQPGQKLHFQGFVRCLAMGSAQRTIQRVCGA